MLPYGLVRIAGQAGVRVLTIDRTIRKATQSELDEVDALYDALLDHLESTINYTRWKKGLYPTRKTAGDGLADSTLFICVQDNRTIGTVILNAIQEAAYKDADWTIEARGDEVLVVHTLAVHPAFMGQGVASALLAFALQYAAQIGAKSIRLDVAVRNTPAISLYEKAGYVRTGTVDLGLNIEGLKWFYCYEHSVRA